MKVVVYLNFIISVIFTICYLYQFFYVFVGLIGKPKRFQAQKNHRFAITISARNEEEVIGQLIASIKNQTYPKELIDIYVVADNSEDKTAQVAREQGAVVFERFDTENVGKGYALNWLFDKINKEYSQKSYDAYIVFDADNVIAPTFVEEMNKVYDNGYKVITSYRNSKNYAANWITAGYSLWFLREAKFLNNSRMRLSTSCAISGTGFLVDCDIIKENGGWIHHLLTEDIEFTTDCVVNDIKIGYCSEAVLYDEQPSTFRQSYVQRLRWSKGFYQVFAKYGFRLLKGICHGKFACYDMLMTLMPAMLLTLFSCVVNLGALLWCFVNPSSYFMILLETICRTLLSFYGVFFLLGAITTITEWKRIYCTKVEKIFYVFTFPLFMLTYVPISVMALFKKVKWDPIKHSVSVTVSDICSEAEESCNPEPVSATIEQ